MKNKTIMILALLFVSSVNAIPGNLPIHGRVTDSNGNPVTTSIGMFFKIYDVSTGGTALYNTGAVTVTPDSSGLYNYTLSNVNLAFDVPYYLGVATGGESEAARIPLNSVGYSYRSNTSDSLSTFPTSNITCTGTDKISMVQFLATGAINATCSADQSGASQGIQTVQAANNTMIVQNGTTANFSVNTSVIATVAQVSEVNNTALLFTNQNSTITHRNSSNGITDSTLLCNNITGATSNLCTLVDTTGGGNTTSALTANRIPYGTNATNLADTNLSRINTTLIVPDTNNSLNLGNSTLRFKTIYAVALDFLTAIPENLLSLTFSTQSLSDRITNLNLTSSIQNLGFYTMTQIEALANLTNYYTKTQGDTRYAGNMTNVTLGYLMNSNGTTNSSSITVGVNQTAMDANYINEGQSAGGDLTGTYPNPSVSSAFTTDAELDNSTIARKNAGGNVTNANVSCLNIAGNGSDTDFCTDATGAASETDPIYAAQNGTIVRNQSSGACTYGIANFSLSQTTGAVTCAAQQAGGNATASGTANQYAVFSNATNLVPQTISTTNVSEGTNLYWTKARQDTSGNWSANFSNYLNSSATNSSFNFTAQAPLNKTGTLFGLNNAGSSGTFGGATTSATCVFNAFGLQTSCSNTSILIPFSAITGTFSDSQASANITLKNSSNLIFNANLSCLNITGGSDSDFCADAVGGGGGNATASGTANQYAVFSNATNLVPQTISTTNVSEGTNLYWTKARQDTSGNYSAENSTIPHLGTTNNFTGNQVLNKSICAAGSVLTTTANGTVICIINNNGTAGTGSCSANQFAISINTGTPTCSQPAFANLSGTATVAQGGTGTSNTYYTGGIVFYDGTKLANDTNINWTAGTKALSATNVNSTSFNVTSSGYFGGNSTCVWMMLNSTSGFQWCKT